jgi:hypothetical protein
MSGELPRGQRVRVSQDPIEGVVTNPNGPVIRVERADGGSFLFEPLSSARIELLDAPEIKPFCGYIAQQGEYKCAALAEYGITYVHGENITHAAETHSCHRHLSFLIEAAPSWAVEEHGAWTHSIVWRLPS